jgi:putative ABC transport system permease protein
MKTLWQDMRYGLRTLLAKPGFTLIAIITLALGIGATSTIFSFVNGILLRPLPFKNPERLVLIDETAVKRGVSSMGVSFPNFVDWREQNEVFSGVAAYDDRSFSLTGGSGEPEQLSGGIVSANTFEILGVPPSLGRSFRPEEDGPDQSDVVILSHGLWERRFGANPGVINQSIIIDNRARTVIGVMPLSFKFPETAELWIPLTPEVKDWTRNDHGIRAVGRLKDGMSLEQAQADMSAVARHIEEQNPVTNEGAGVNLIPLRDALVGGYRKALLLLLGVVGLVLAVACANVANLLLARASARQREIAVRSALGASRWRVFRQLLTESFLLGAAGGALGLLLASWGLDLLLAAIPVDLPFWMKFTVDWRVLGFAAGTALLTSLVFGVAPALQASRIDLNETLKEGGRGGAGASRHPLRRALVISEVALSLILLISAGLMMRSFLRLQQVNPGLKAENVLTLRVSLPNAKYDVPEKRQDFFKQLLERTRALPGVESAGAISYLPLSEGGWGRSLTVEGYPVLPVGQAPSINHCVVTPGYFRAMGITLLAGRDISDADTRDSAKVVIVDERLAREYWPNESALGKRIRFGPPEDNEPWHTIVGVVGEVKHESLNLTQRKSVYLPHAQVTIGGMALAVRTRGNPESLAAAVRAQVRELDPNQPVTAVRTMSEILSRSVWQPRLYAILFGIFAAVALLLASVGIYGVMSYTVTQRTHEIGIRMALGAQRGDVLRLVIRQGMWLALVGVVIGVLASLALTGLMQSLLFGIGTTDPVTFASVAALLSAAALVACYIPARRATKVDPMIALRYE